jgi:hypothetical protein
MTDTYDAGYLPDDEMCNQDSIRVELANAHDFYSSIIENKNERIAELEEIVAAVAHIGVDFGYGKYELEAGKIDDARTLMEQDND